MAVVGERQSRYGCSHRQGPALLAILDTELAPIIPSRAASQPRQEKRGLCRRLYVGVKLKFKRMQDADVK